MTEKKPVLFFLFILTGILFLLICIKAFSLGITNDEAYTFHNVNPFWGAEFFCTGNSHWLNSAAIKLSSHLGFEGEGQIRWLSILSAGGFFSSGFLWMRETRETHLKFLIFSFAFLNPYILDYFSLARGYAPGLTLQTLGFTLFIASLKNPKRSLAFASLLFSGLSVLANFTFLVFFVAFIIFYFHKHYIEKGKTFVIKSFLADLLVAFIIILTAVKALLFIVNCSNDLVGAGGESYFNSVFFSFIDELNYKKDILPNNFIYGSAILFFVFIIVSIIIGLLNFKKHLDPVYFYSSAFLMALFLIIGINHIFFNLPYPAYRSSVLFFPFFCINSVCLFRYGLNKKILIYGLSLLLCLNFIVSVNFKKTFDFDWNTDSKKSFDFLENVHANRVGICKEHYGVFANYYQLTSHYKYRFKGELINTFLPKGHSEKKNKLSEYDYLILYPPYDLIFYKNNSVKFEGVKLFPDTKTLIVKIIK
jgi:hypothetical protein